MKDRFVSGVCLIIILAAALPLAAQQYKEIEVKNGGAIHGSVTLKGTPPPPEIIPVSKDTAVCGKSKTLESLITGKNGGVKNVIVGLEGITQGKKMLQNVDLKIDQTNCEYAPHIVILPKGADLHIVNDDTLLHNVHAYDLTAKEDGQTGPPTLFNIALPLKGMKIAKPMSQSGLIRILCDAGHPWMNGYVLVTEHPYFAITDADGNFTLDQVPPGTYTITIWHEGMARIEKTTKAYIASEACKTTRKVTVTPGAVTNVDFTLTLKETSTQETLLSAQ